jgi:hypothetical protein
VVNLKVDPQAPDRMGLIVTDRVATHFMQDWEDAKAFERMLWSHQNLGQFISVLPLSFALQLYEYAKGHNAFSRYVKSCFMTEGISGNMERSYISLERSKILNHYINFKVALGLSLEDDTIFHCNLRDGSTLAKAANMMNVQKNKARLKRVQRILHGEEEPLSDFVDEG